MKSSYKDLIGQSYTFPQEGFRLDNGYLTFHGVSLHDLIKKHGTPFKLFYLPRVAEQIDKAKRIFAEAIANNNYRGNYSYCYCTKCCHFAPMVKAAVKEQVDIETSSAFDIDLIFNLLEQGVITSDITVIHNGHKTKEYLRKIIKLNKAGFKNSILILDSKLELQKLKQLTSTYKGMIKLGIRIAIDEEPQSVYFSSRLGIRASSILDFYHDEIENSENFELKMVHFFVDSGISDTTYYWDEFKKALNVFVALKKACKDITALNLGGGFPIKNSLNFKYDYAYMANELVANIKAICVEANIEEPNLYTEFGRYTVGESGAIIFQVLEQKKQNDQEEWYMVDNSLMNTLPDTWSIQEKFLLLPINKWDNNYTKVNIGGISCDQSDHYNTEDANQQLYLPQIGEGEEEPLYIGFFHTGAYQDAISGYGGIKHCLIPAPKLIIIERDASGTLIDTVHRNEQSVDEMLDILGYYKEN